jgi:hypothetical protein
MAENLQQEKLRWTLESWRNQLIDLGPRNKLLNFRHTATTTLEIREPAIDELLSGLRRGVPFAPLSSSESDDSETAHESQGDGIVT